MTMLSPTQRYNLRTRYLEVLIDEAAAHPSAELYDRIERLLELDRPRLVPDFRDILQSAPQRLEPMPASSSFWLVDTPREDAPEDTKEAEKPESESGELDIPEGTRPRAELTPVGARSERRKIPGVPGPGRVAAFPCAKNPAGNGRHLWVGPRDPDGWFRCAFACGAGKRASHGGRVSGPDEVPPAPQAVSSALLEEACASVALDGETQAFPPREEPVSDELEAETALPERSSTDQIDAIVDLPNIDESINPSGDDEGWGDFVAATDTRLEEAFTDVAGVEEQEAPETQEEDDEDSGEGVLRARGLAVDPASLAPLVGRDDTPEHLTRVAPCTRCATGQFARDPLEPNDPTAYACIACGHRPRLTREEAFALEQELRRPGKLRQRGASIGGIRL